MKNNKTLRKLINPFVELECKNNKLEQEIRWKS